MKKRVKKNKKELKIYGVEASGLPLTAREYTEYADKATAVQDLEMILIKEEEADYSSVRNMLASVSIDDMKRQNGGYKVIEHITITTKGERSHTRCSV